MADGNYVHICYQSKLQARTVSPAHTVGHGVLSVVRSGWALSLMQALSKNGKIFDNGIMIGVKQCIDKVLTVPTCTLYSICTGTCWLEELC